jgi:tRNA(Ile)-lysidine synthase
VPKHVSPDRAIRAAFESGLLPGAPLLLAVSGGPDSMALLTAFREVGPELGTEFAVGHVDHGWRGSESKRHAEFVARFCRRRGIAFHLAEGKPDSKGRSREEAAREFRYDRLRAIASAIGAAGVVTAHTEDDAAETLLLALLRGRPLAGLAGIRERRPDAVFRPFLAVSRRSVLAYLRSRRVPYRTDSSNADLSLDRNWVRRRVVPLLARRFGDSVSANLAASAEALARDWEWLSEVFQRNTEAAIELVPGAARIPRSALDHLPPAAIRRALLVMSRAAGGDRFAPSRRELLALERLASSGSDFRFQAGRRVEFLASRGHLRAFRIAEKTS